MAAQDSVVFRGLNRQAVVTRALDWLRRHPRDFRIVGLTWWTEDAYDPRPDREGDYIWRHTRMRLSHASRACRARDRGGRC
ncbi:MAG: hypothetical protein ACREX8_19335 [Gammaproteobacteria bacterium]